MQHKYSPPILAERYPIAFIAALIDILLIMGGAYLAYYVRFDRWEMLDRYAAATVTIALTAVLCKIALNTYSSWRGRQFFTQLARVYFAWFIAIAVVTALAVFLKVAEDYSRLWLGTTLAFAIGFITAFRLVAFLVLRQARKRGRNLKGVVLIEMPDADHGVNTRLSELAEHGYKISARIPMENTEGWLHRLDAEVKASGAHEVWLCLPMSQGAEIKEILYALRHLTVEIRYLPDLGDLPLLNHSISNIAGLYALDISCTPMTGPSRLLKRLEDIALGLLLSIVVLPLCALIAIAIKATSKGPVIFKQHRMGINGRRFRVYKFRSMEVHSEKDGEVTQAAFGDPRVTRLGAFLRRTSLDELPQFYNVLQGRMSIVGPRPHALAHNDHYKDLVESYMKRHKVKPGITGWAQVNGYRGETDTVEKMHKRVEYDLWYINNWSLRLDLKIIFLTIFKGFVNQQP